MKNKLHLTIRTGADVTELLLINSGKIIGELKSSFGRELSYQIVPKIEMLLKKNSIGYQDLGGVVVYRGPGSFTSLRIGLTVANTIAFAQKIPIYGVAKNDAVDWWKKAKKSSLPVLPFYGAPPHISKPKKH